MGEAYIIKFILILCGAIATILFACYKRVLPAGKSVGDFQEGGLPPLESPFSLLTYFSREKESKVKNISKERAVAESIYKHHI